MRILVFCMSTATGRLLYLEYLVNTDCANNQMQHQLLNASIKTFL